MKTNRLAPHKLFLLAVASVALTFTGCHKNHEAPSAPTTDIGIASAAPSAAVPPTVSSFTAEPTTINLGDPVVLNWQTMNATSVNIDGVGSVAPNGTQTVMPSNSTNFHLTATSAAGTAEANVRVTVRVPTTQTTTDTSSTVTDSAFHAAVQDVFFDYDSYDLRPDAKQAASGAAVYLGQHPDIKVLIGGYCDERGSAEYNLALGENRANSAKTALVNAGVSASRIRVVSFGKEKQFCTESTESCWQQNRRAQFSIDK